MSEKKNLSSIVQSIKNREMVIRNDSVQAMSVVLPYIWPEEGDSKDPSIHEKDKMAGDTYNPYTFNYNVSHSDLLEQIQASELAELIKEHTTSKWTPVFGEIVLVQDGLNPTAKWYEKIFIGQYGEAYICCEVYDLDNLKYGSGILDVSTWTSVRRRPEKVKVTKQQVAELMNIDPEQIEFEI